LEENEERMVRYVLDQSYAASTIPQTLNKDRVLDLDVREYQGKKEKFTTCMICQEDFENGVQVPNIECGHLFHQNCLGEWVKQKPTCPFCDLTLPTIITSRGSKRRREGSAVDDS